MEVETEKARMHAIVSGSVQGVGFRYFVQDTAVALHLKGWVRNLWRGDVEVMAEGERPALEQLLAALRRGPRSAQVDSVHLEWGEYTGEFRSFHIKYTY
jgi:acylphosphatase